MGKNNEEAAAPAEEQKPVETKEAEAPAPAAEEQPKEELPPKEEPAPVDRKRTWRAKMNCQMPTRDFVKNETVELYDREVTPRHRALFECLDADAEPKKADPDIAVMVSRLKAAKVPMKKNMSEEAIRELFDKFLGSGATAGEISKDAK